MAADQRPTSHESERQRWNRNFGDLLQELRVTQTGVQILFAFLLTLPFSSGFPSTTEFQKNTYIVALMAAAFAAAMIISPVAFHRALFRRGRKPELVRYAHKMATGGLALLLVSMVSSVLLIADYMMNIWAASLLAALTASYFLTFWAAIPFAKRTWMDDEFEEANEAYRGPAAEPNEPSQA